jgi:hypothetical protein
MPKSSPAPRDTPNERSQRARIGAHAMHAQHDARETTAKARAAFLARFLDEVDPNRELPEPERLRRAEHARSAYFARLAYRSARARRANRGANAKTAAPANGNAAKEHATDAITTEP